MSAQKIVNKFRKFGLPVDGVAILRNDILAIGDRTIDVHSCNYGYIRTSGRKRYSKGQQITGCDFLNNVTEDLFLVLIIDEGKSLDAYINAARHILDADQDVTILEIDVNKEAIQRAERIPPSLNKIAKISFQYSYQEVGKCEEGVCEYVADVECDVEPCESKSFCERVQECIEPVDSDCTLQVGSGCCDYSVEGIELQTGVCITIPEIINVEDWGDTSEFSIGFQFGDEAQTTWFVNFSEPFEQITSDEIISALQLAYGEQQEVVFTYEINGNTICITPNVDYIGICFVAEAGFLNNGGVASTAITDTNLCSDFVIDGQYENTDELCANAIENICVANDHAQNGLFIGLLTFQVLINDVWTEVTDEVENGTWQRTNVCDDVITQWRIIDSEDNVINSGDVTATCEGSTEVTDSVCNWLQEHQTAIEELQNNPSGLTCENISQCPIIVGIEEQIANLPTPQPQIQSDWNQANNAAVDFIKNKPVIPSISGLVPYTGAVADVNLGDKKLITDAVQFDLTPSATPSVGQLQWNDTDGTLDLGMKGSAVTQQIGMEQYIRAKSSTNAGIAEGYVYYIIGATGGNKEVALAQANTSLASKSTIGIATETVSGGNKAFITTFGLVRGLPDALFTGINEGDTLYLSATTPGTFQNTAPTSPNHRIRIGYCVRKQSNNNDVFVSIQLGLDLNELCDVEAPSPNNGDYIEWNTLNSRWQSKAFPTNVSAFTNDANYITLAQARAGSYTKFFADFGNTSVNTNTTNNVIGSVLIPANTITGNAILEIESAISRATGGANPQHRLYINTSASFGGTQIASLGIGTTSLWVKGERSFKAAANSLRGFSFTTAASIDDTANTNAPSATTPDWTVDQYILTVANNATGETTTHEYTTVKVLTV
jgi:hypothetical protein